ncbi:MAG: PAS domain S-box protein [Marinobacter sp.]|uniref:methyl-accepting chemotaxis protein n=1 Tax=Marinobacter sp. TaxID=50741 RepID=UPI00299F1E3E|nr:PAS domain S-box protein [Marinobacter sp.]MDX1755516.1 PAS domain S-box protein [Marinobacter sp.]
MRSLMWGRLRLDWFGGAAERERLQKVVEYAPNAIVLIDSDGKILLVNAQTEALFGYSRQELIGETVEVLVPQRFRSAHPDYRKMFFDQPVKRAMGAGRDLYGLRKDASEFPIEIGLNPIPEKGGMLALASIIDITERKREEERFRQVIESAPNAMILVGGEGQITLINSQAESLFGYARSELIGQPIEMLVPHRFRDAHPGHRASFFANPTRRAMGAGRDLYGLRKDGSEFPVEIGLNPIPSPDEPLALASVIDITERKRAEERFRQVIESVPNAIVLVNQAGKIALVNAQTEKLFGYSRQQLIGEPVETLIPQRFRAAHSGFLAAYFTKPSTRAMGAGRELYGRRNDAQEFPVEIGLNPMKLGDEILVLASIIDITERKRADREMRKIIQEMHQGISVLGRTSGEIMDSVNRVATSTQETASSINRISSAVHQVKQGAVAAGRKANAVTTNVERTRTVAEEGKLAVDETMEGMLQIREQMQAIGESIIRLNEQTQAIGEVVTAVNDLAEQSNLLGVNASIEAARAGEVGKGFSVVAQEVKALADQSKSATAQVRTILSDIQKAMNKAVLVAEQGGKAVDAGYQRTQVSGKAIQTLLQSTNESNEAAMQIAETSRQQAIGVDQIAQGMETIQNASKENVSGIRQVEDAVRNLHQLGSRLQEVAAQFRLDDSGSEDSS